jgi:hypothetical protein
MRRAVSLPHNSPVNWNLEHSEKTSFNPCRCHILNVFKMQSYGVILRVKIYKKYTIGEEEEEEEDDNGDIGVIILGYLTFI